MNTTSQKLSDLKLSDKILQTKTFRKVFNNSKIKKKRFADNGVHFIFYMRNKFYSFRLDVS